ncbi:MAG: YolD-like family protein [Lachnospiraceae bacterium]|nr:YolD-like family protein [Lachnospiraceae bacterium]
MAQTEDRLTYENYLKRSRHARMSNAQRAKIFAPYDALEGLFETMHAKETVSEPRRELSDSGAEELNDKLLGLRVGSRAAVTYYRTYESRGRPVSEYTEIRGIVNNIDELRRSVRIVDTDIPFDDIIDIRPP